MRLKKLGATLVVVAAFGAVLAGSAFAAATTTDVLWYTGMSPGSVLGSPATVTSSQVGVSTFETTISSMTVEFHSTNIECVECKIENSGGTAVGHGKLKFTGVTLAKPSSCTTSSTITTNMLSLKADYMIGSVDYILFEPSAGPGSSFLPFTLSGIPCPISGTFSAKGTMFVEAEKTTGTQEPEQIVASSATINTTAGGSLHVGTPAASLAGEIKFSIGGTPFGTH